MEHTKDDTSIQQISIKASDFMETVINSWFSIVKMNFYLRSITVYTTKFYTVIVWLPMEIVTKIPLKVLDPQDYEELKKTLIEVYERMKSELQDKLMSTATSTGQP